MTVMSKRPLAAALILLSGCAAIIPSLSAPNQTQAHITIPKTSPQDNVSVLAAIIPTHVFDTAEIIQVAAQDSVTQIQFSVAGERYMMKPVFTNTSALASQAEDERPLRSYALKSGAQAITLDANVTSTSQLSKNITD